MKRYFNIIIVLVAVVLALLSSLVFKKYESLNLVRGRISIKEDELQSQEEYFQKLKDVSDKLQANKDSLLKIESALPGSPQVPELLAFIQRSASQSGLVLGDINLGLMSAEDNIKKTKVNFILSGEYIGLKKFIPFIENSSRLIDVNSIHFSYPEKGELFKFNFKITAYSY